MKKAIACISLLLLLSAINNTIFAQSAPIINHLALYVKDLNKSVEFYKKVMQFVVIDEPFKDGKHVWFRTGDHSQLHLIQGENLAPTRDNNIHFAYSVKDVNKFVKRLDSLRIKYSDLTEKIPSVTKRPDGIMQVYFRDPDNFWIEVNNDKF